MSSQHIYSGPRVRDTNTFIQKSEPAILYHIRIYNDVVSFEKIGHTRKTLEERFKNLSSAGYHYEVLHIIHTTWYDALLKEELVAEHLKNANLFCRVRELKYTGVGGWTECYPEGEYDPSHLFIRL